MDQVIKVSVRNLVEFILRSGDLTSSSGKRDPDAMLAGGRLHRKIQRRMGAGYQAEVMLSIDLSTKRDALSFTLTVEGRADGVYKKSQDEPVIIDEIKCIYAPLSTITEMNKTHRAQALCYAYMYAAKHELKEMTIQLTYCHIESETIKQFQETLTIEQLKDWFMKLTSEYCKWAAWSIQWKETRNASIRKTGFPFTYREGQKELVTGVYRTILRNKKLFIEAPTGVGKTISTVFPAVKAMGEELTSKLFYLTAKTITRTVAEDTFQKLIQDGVMMKVVTITSKEKICILNHPACNPDTCERAKGHFDRVNDAVFDLLTNESKMSRALIEEYAKKHCVCPFEMCLDTATWADAIICDYNYVFDPNVYLKRFFQQEKKQDYLFLIDEAHNLVDRAREMYSAILIKQQFLEVKQLIKEKSPKLAGRLNACNEVLLRYQRECENVRLYADIGEFVLPLLRLMTEFEEFLKENADFDGKDIVMTLYFDVRHFLAMYECMDDDYQIYSDYGETGEFQLKLLCMNPARNLLSCLNKGRSSIFFSATLLPIDYYKEQLGGTKEDYAVYAPSPFLKERRLLMVAGDVSTKYTRRTREEYNKIACYIRDFVSLKAGNYFVFFPSYKMMRELYELLSDLSGCIELQKSNMTEEEKESFLNRFTKDPKTTRIGFCVMGGIFSEGIDLTQDRLIGAVIVGTGLPQICNEREIFKEYYDKRSHSGFHHAYLYQGMNKVLQSAGRVIRTINDKGAILLLDERFLMQQYRNLFPREWENFLVVDLEKMRNAMQQFWKD